MTRQKGAHYNNMYPHFQQIQEYIDSNRENILEMFRTLVNLEGHYKEKENVEKARDYVQKLLEQEGFVCRTREVAEDRAGTLIGILGEDRPGKPILFSGHIDTVFYAGTFDGPDPFHVKDGKAYGPGVLDMKGGIIIAIAAIQALNHIGFRECPIKVVFLGEEESDHEGSIGDQIVTEEARGCQFAFNMEVSRLNNSVSVARKGQHIFYMHVEGTGGHAGNDFWKGTNAINEAVLKIQEMLKLTNAETETTVTPSIIHGGSHQCAIAASCDVTFDVRVATEQERERVFSEVDRIMNTTFISGTTTTYRFFSAKLPPLRPTPDVLALYEFINAISEDNGFGHIDKILQGGSNDAGNIQKAGIPVICSCGTRGEFAHNQKEYCLLESVYDRAKIFATAVANYDRFSL